MFTKKNNFKQCICILEDSASGEQVGEILLFQKITMTSSLE
jgi:hypothetical protein